MKVAATFIKHNVMTILLYLMVIVFGFYSFSTLPLALMPSMEVPAAIVYATYPGAGPEDIEQQVAKPLESAVAGLSGLDTLQSTSSENMAMLVVQFTDSTGQEPAPRRRLRPDRHEHRHRFHAGRAGRAARL